jgi:hypothetical protein
MAPGCTWRFGDLNSSIPAFSWQSAQPSLEKQGYEGTLLFEARVCKDFLASFEKNLVFSGRLMIRNAGIEAGTLWFLDHRDGGNNAIHLCALAHDLH